METQPGGSFKKFQFEIKNPEQNGNGEQKSRFLPPLCSGELCGALAMSEPGAGAKKYQNKYKYK